jgi:hypothetical protein
MVPEVLHPMPVQPFALAAASKRAVPVPDHIPCERTQHWTVPGHAVATMVPKYDATRVRVYLGNGIILPLVELLLHFFEFAPHPLLVSLPQHLELPLPRLVTRVHEAEEVKGHWPSLISSASVLGRKAPKLDQPCLLRIEREIKLAHPGYTGRLAAFITRPILEPTDDGVVERTNVDIEHPVRLLYLDVYGQSFQDHVRAAPWTESIRKISKVDFVDDQQHLDGRSLDNLNLQGDDPQRASSTVWLRNVYAYYRLCSVRSSLEPVGRIRGAFFQPLTIDSPRHPIHTWCSLSFQTEVCLSQAVHAPDVAPECGELSSSISNRCFSYSLKRMLQPDSPVLCLEPGLLARIPFGQSPSLYPLHRWRSGPATSVQEFPRYSGTVRLPTPFIIGVVPLDSRCGSRYHPTAGPDVGPPGSRTRYLSACTRSLTASGSVGTRDIAPSGVTFLTSLISSAPGSGSFLSRLNTGPTPLLSMFRLCRYRHLHMARARRGSLPFQHRELLTLTLRRFNRRNKEVV